MIETIVDFLKVNNEAMSIAGNVITFGMMLLLSMVVIYHLFKTQMSFYLKALAFGVLLEAIGWGFQRLYWVFWWYFKMDGDTDIESLKAWYWMTDNAWLTLIPMTIVNIGLVFILTPLFIKNADDNNRIMPYIAGFVGVVLSWFITLYIVNKTVNVL